VLVLDSTEDPIQHGEGSIAAVVLSDGEIIEHPAPPSWWGSLGSKADVLLAHGPDDLGPDLVHAITAARGAVAMTQIDGHTSGFALGDDAAGWVRAEAARREVQG
jgi:hypothetical protein